MESCETDDGPTRLKDSSTSWSSEHAGRAGISSDRLWNGRSEDTHSRFQCWLSYRRNAEGTEQKMRRLLLLQSIR